MITSVITKLVLLTVASVTIYTVLHYPQYQWFDHLSKTNHCHFFNFQYTASSQKVGFGDIRLLLRGRRRGTPSNGPAAWVLVVLEGLHGNEVARVLVLLGLQTAVVELDDEVSGLSRPRNRLARVPQALYARYPVQ